ncbi:MAG: hypothetical protein M3444_05980 [Acidobacteriota bacterium]|nr:hypothetical protein [Acidobacteriota bacterium]MDQ5836991.1 hypothetical protein [Acidobacteriota bacterium]
MPRFGLTLLALFCLLASASRDARAAPHAPDDKELRKAEAVLSKLLRLEESAATDAANPSAFDETAGRLYPALFVNVSALSDGDLKTELATAAALYDSARGARAGSAVHPDCSRELRESYFRLCLESGDRARLARAKAALHTRRAQALLLYARGDRERTTLDVLADLRAERGTDLSLAEEALNALKELAGAQASKQEPVSAQASKQTPDQLSASPDPSASLEPSASPEPSTSLEQLDRLLASLPRTRVRQLLASARDAFRDGLFWQLKSLPAHSLVVSADSFTDPERLRPLDLSAGDASRTALQNLRAAQKFISKAEAAIEESRRGDGNGE